MNRQSSRSRLITGCGMLAAVAVVLQYIEISLPFLPSFLKLDLSDLPELLGAYAYGPVAGLVITAVKNLIHMLVSQTLGVGELSNFLLGAVFSVLAGMLYQWKKSKKQALLAGLVASVAMAAVSFPVNLYVIYPMYYQVMGFPQDVILNMYQVILPTVTSIPQALLIFNVPLTLVKGLLCLLFSMWIYKPLSTTILKSKTR